MSDIVYRNLGELFEEAKRKYHFKDSKGYIKRKKYPMNHPKSHVFSTGFYSVKKVLSPNYKQGFCYTYIYYKDDKYRQYSSVDILKLKQKVLDNNMLWKVVDKQKALDIANFHDIDIEVLL